MDTQAGHFEISLYFVKNQQNKQRRPWRLHRPHPSSPVTPPLPSVGLPPLHTPSRPLIASMWHSCLTRFIAIPPAKRNENTVTVVQSTRTSQGRHLHYLRHLSPQKMNATLPSDVFQPSVETITALSLEII
jgi:hypothetical protein